MSTRGIRKDFRRVLPDPAGLGGGKKSRLCPRSRTRFSPARRAACSNQGELWSFVAKKTQECWLWTALCRRTRQIVACTIGDRSQEAAKSLRAHVPPGYRRRATRSDFWLACEGVFPTRTHRFCGKQEGETNHAQRWFGTLRARMSRLVRRAYSFSKKIERHLDAVHLFIASYNLKIKQATID